MGSNKSLVTSCQAFKTSDNRTHPSKLIALVEEKKIAIRGVFHASYEKRFNVPLKNGTIATSELVALLADSASQIADVCKKFDNAIKRERISGEKVEVQA